jgi:hypothetical protein
VDHLVNCPLCDEPLASGGKVEKSENAKLFVFGLAFIGGLGAATLSNMLGYTGLAMGLGMVGLASMVILVIKMFSDKAPAAPHNSRAS